MQHGQNQYPQIEGIANRTVRQCGENRAYSI